MHSVTRNKKTFSFDKELVCRRQRIFKFVKTYLCRVQLKLYYNVCSFLDSIMVSVVITRAS